MISIITPVLNGEKFIFENIKSIEKLNIDYEHIIVDGGSTDKTIEIINKFPTIKLIHQKEKTGMYGGIDLGFREAKGDFICWVNCDDRIIPENFAKLYKYALSGRFDFVCSDGQINDLIKEKKIRIKGTKFVKYFLKEGVFPFLQPSTIYTKKLYLDVNGLDFMRYKIIGDMDLFYRMALNPDSKFGYIGVTTSVFIKYGNSLGDKNGDVAKKEREMNGIIPKPKKHIKYLLRITRLLNV